MGQSTAAKVLINKRPVFLELVLGAVAGAAGAWVMDRVGGYMYKHEDRDAMARELQARKGGQDVRFTDAEKAALDQQPGTGRVGKDTSHAAVEKAGSLSGINVRTGQPNPAGIIVHYGLGVLPGALHAVIRQKAPVMRAGGGVLYDLGLFVVNDEMAGPLLGLASGPRSYPWQAHARGLAAHLILGVVTETVLRLFDSIR